MVNILTEQNVTRSIAQLGPRDVYIRPALDGIGAADFERHAGTAERGRIAALGVARQLSALSLPPAAYAAWQKRLQQAERVPPRVDAIEIGTMARVPPEVVQQHLHQQAGQPLDSAQLARDLVNVFGEGDFEQVDYRLVREGRGEAERRLLRIDATEKRWGPEYLRLGLALSTTLGQGASYALRLAWHRTWLNARGGELLAVGELGNTNGASLEWFQPLAAASPLFGDASAAYRRERLDIFAGDDRISEYVIERSRLGVGAGMRLGALGSVRAGLHATRWRPSLVTGLPLMARPPTQQHGPLIGLDLDQLDRRFFPTDGWALRLDVAGNRAASVRYTRASLDLRHARSIGDWVLGSRVAWTGSPRGRLPIWDGASLGGFLNLSAYSPNQVAGDSARYAHLRAERVLGQMPLGMRGDLRLGAALELARIGGVYVPTRHDGTLHALTAYLGGDTPFGPVYLGLAHSLSGVTNAYLFIGAP
jgi:NTE family protein